MTFQQYAGLREHSTVYREGIIKAMFNAQYRALPDKLRHLYDLMTPDALAEVEKIRTSNQIPLIQAIQEYLATRGARNQLKQYQQAAGPERQDVRRVTPAPYEFGQYSNQPGFKRYPR